MRRPTLLALASSAFVLSACMSGGGTREEAATASPASAPAAAEKRASTAIPPPPFDNRFVRDDRVLLGPQPTADILTTMSNMGVRHVINLRTPEEMAALDFDEEEWAASQGMAYSLIPMAGNAGFTPAALDAFTAAMADEEGTVLLHCASGTRAGHLYAAWLVREKGVSPEEAMRRVGPLGLWPLPMERLLGRPLRLDFAPAPEG